MEKKNRNKRDKLKEIIIAKSNRANLCTLKNAYQTS